MYSCCIFFSRLMNCNDFCPGLHGEETPKTAKGSSIKGAALCCG